MMRGFGPIIWTGLILSAALSCYLVSLQVASERAELERIEREIITVTRDIRELETEIGTRGRLSQLEKWNAGFLQLEAPDAEQFLEGSFQLATLMKPRRDIAPDAPVILAAAPNSVDEDEYQSASLEEMVTQASYGEPEEAPAPPTDPLAPLPEGEDGDDFTFITPGDEPTQP